jgi:uncharacterized protein YkwD
MRRLLARGRIPENALVRQGLQDNWQPASAVFPPSAKKIGRAWGHLILPLLFLALLVIALMRDNPTVLNFLPFPSVMGKTVKGASPTAYRPETLPALVASFPSPEAPEPVLTRQRIILWTNEARVQQMLLPLTENRRLDIIAAERVNDMLQKQYFAHVSPSREGVAETAKTIGYRYRVLAENIAKGAFGDDERVVRGWLQSPGHRKNILSRDIEEIGAAVGKGRLNGEIVWVAVQVFGKPAPQTRDGLVRSLPADRGSLPCLKPNGFLDSRAEALRTEIAAGRDQLKSLKTDIENRRKLLLSQARKEETMVARTTGDYRERITGYNLLMEEVGRKEQLAGDMGAQYNLEMEVYNGCIKN